jgi:hypothetical protein
VGKACEEVQALIPFVDFINHDADGPALDVPGCGDDGAVWLTAAHEYAPCDAVSLRSAPRTHARTHRAYRARSIVGAAALCWVPQ